MDVYGIIICVSLIVFDLFAIVIIVSVSSAYGVFEKIADTIRYRLFVLKEIPLKIERKKAGDRIPKRETIKRRTSGA